jgi:hypothetical protein
MKRVIELIIAGIIGGAIGAVIGGGIVWLLTSSNKENGEAGKDPEIPYFRKMDVVARDVRGPYILRGSHRHRAQRVILSNGHGQYEI